MKANRWRWHATAVVLFAAASAAAYWPIGLLSSSRITVSGGDVAELVWVLGWLPHALAHGLNPFFSSAINRPYGVNLASNTSMPLLALVAAPITALAGPVAAYNLLVRAAFFFTALSMYLSLGRRVRPPVAIVGALLFAFSPYMIGQGYNHLNLIFLPLVPPTWSVLERIVSDTDKRRQRGLVFGALIACQFLVSAEVAGDEIVVALLVLLIIAVFRPSRALAGAPRVIGAGLWAVLPFLILCGYPIWYLAFGPHHLGGSPQAYELSGFRSDLLNPLFPNVNQAIFPHLFGRLGQSFAVGDYVENGAYLGAPLLLAMIGLSWPGRRRAALRVGWVGLAVSFVLSLGTRLNVANHVTSLPLPFAALDKIPLLRDESASRYAFLVWLFAVVIFVVGLDALCDSLAARGALRRRSVAIGGLVGAALIAASLWPNLPFPSQPVDTPAFFTSVDVEVLSPGALVLSYPYPLWPYTEPMIWQASAWMRFSLLGGSFNVPQRPAGASEGIPPLLAPLAVQTLMAYEIDGLSLPATYGPAAPLEPPPPNDAATAAAIRQFIRHYKVDAVVIDASEPGAATVASYFATALRTQPAQLGGVYVWLAVQKDAAG